MSIVKQTVTQSFDIEKLKIQQKALDNQGRMNWIHWLIVGMTLLITVIAWQTSTSALASQKQIQFDREAERVISLMLERIEHYSDALLSGAAAIQAQDGKTSRSQWKQYTDYLKLTERYPGANGIGVIHYVDTQEIPEFLKQMRQELPGFTIHPEHPYELALPIVYIEPEDVNAAAVGLDVAFETNRRDAAMYARTSGLSQISGPIVLVQDAGKTPGFLFYVPYYKQLNQPVASWSDTQRQERFQGLVYAPVVVEKLVEGVLSAKNRTVSLSIYDQDTLLYAESSTEESPEFTMREKIPMHGRIWTYDIVSRPMSAVSTENNQPMIVLISGLFLDTMLLGLFWSMSRTNQRTISLAREMTDTLSNQAQQLSENNNDLENFAHVVSHDLKAPIRNIQSLVCIINEDFEDYLASNDEGLEIKETLDMVSNQVNRGQNLIDGILSYSKVGAELGQIETVDTRALVLSISQQLHLSSEQLTLSGSFPVLVTHATLLEQVFSNLIGNAIKFNTIASLATVEVSVKQMNEEYFCFAVKDNGPGIESRFHKRIFKQFASLNTNSNIISSGIGLSIVKRALDMTGCTITLDSAKGKGSTFSFTWPVTHADSIPDEEKLCA